MRIYNRALDATQVSNLYNGLPIGPGAGPGTVVLDTSGYSAPLDLTIAEPADIQWLAGTGLHVIADTKIVSPGPATKLFNALTATNKMTLEAIFTPQDVSQGGPARIVSYSADPSVRNFTLGQSQTRYDQRLRTTTTSSNGIPSTTSDYVLTTAPQHVVVTYNGGEVRLYRNGALEKRQSRTGTFNWNSSYRFMLANEDTNDRPWLGQLHGVAIYDQALNAVQSANLFDGLTPGDGRLNYRLRWLEQP